MMNKPVRLATIGLFLVVLIAAITQVSCQPTVNTEKGTVEDNLALLWGPYITNTSSTSATINWKTEESREGTVEYSANVSNKRQSQYELRVPDTDKQLHHVNLVQLQPDTVYHYRVDIGDKNTPDYTFRTLGGNSYKFIVYGDTQEQLPTFTQLDRHRLVADRIAAEPDISFVIHTGDVVGQADNPDEWNRFFEAARKMLASTSLFVVRGNHDENEQLFQETFGSPDWYSFDDGEAHFTLMDSNNWADLDAETQWLRNDIAGDAKLKFVFFHHPLYSSNTKNWGGNPQLRDLWEDIFIQNHVYAVFNGHIHAYERIYAHGIQYIVNGMGGGPSYDLDEKKVAGYQNSMEYVLGYAKITVNGDKCTIDIIRVADISREGKGVEKIYPPNTVFETIK